ncbi:MAG: hypothetical protein V3S32_02975 [Acidimicrobiia bacterium]
MTNAATYLDAEGLSRRDLLRRGLIGGGLVAAGLATPGLTGVAQAKGGKSIVLDVDTHGFDDFQTPASVGPVPPGDGPFYVSGDILTPGTSDNIGRFQCWGFISAKAPGDGVVNQEFAIDGRGKILIAGVESGAPRAVTGGTGDFANARGVGVPDLTLFESDGIFTIAFNLTGASGPPIG